MSHLWGFPIDDCKNLHILNPLSKNSLLIKLSNIYSILTKNRFGDLLIETSILLKINEYKSIYCISGRLFFLPLLKKLGIIKTKLIILIYRVPVQTPFWKLHNLHHSLFILGTYDGINCLTIYTRDKLRSLLCKNIQIECLEWCTDTAFYSNIDTDNNCYFFSSGKTNRDYRTLVQAARMNHNLKFVVIGHFDEELLDKVPSNMKIIRTNVKKTDTAISYSELKEYYSNSIAVCIPLNDDHEDTCGYTELLESMAMGKPVIKAKTGCLDVDIEKMNVGYYYEPYNANDLSDKINLLYNNPTKAKRLGLNGKRLVNEKYNINVYKERVKQFIDNIS
jgi:glycosyltransferase involved in cell wall biosynthesis